ncbi:facilitated trehalose transporter Tret1-like [Achroia grisella]|uniref:facilitated trehalose transporter Tret1-like n=1 Tax=Achroia grisella TaxID=688607 RepID=UPI0027D274AF|nr:facilitated trehalose transporter Tret1-like [Achroia grisella]
MSFILEIKPFLRQCLVTAGVSLCMMEHGLVVSFASVLIPQLRKDDIYVNENMETWIASIQSTSLFLGAFITPYMMSRYGRRKANLVCSVLMIVGWISVMVAPSAGIILFGRFMQGVALGISSLTGSVLVAEYSSPRYRGTFMTIMTLSLISGCLVIHILGSLFPWRKAAGISLGITIVDLIVIAISPESPMFLVTRGRYDECRKVFHWLRGLNEDEELEAMIKSDMRMKESHIRPNTKKFINGVREIIQNIKDPEFFKPLIVLWHLVIINIWCGGLIVDVYANDIYPKLMGSNVDVVSIIIIADCVRLASLFCAIVVHTKFKRRHMLILLVSLNVVIYFVIAGCSYLIDRGFITNSIVGLILIIVHIFIHSIGATALTNTLPGEILPLKYKGIHSMLSTFFVSLNITVAFKTLPYLFSHIGLSAAYCIYGSIIAYGMIVAAIMMPETNGRTLLSIEEHWKKPVKETYLTKSLSTPNEDI